MSKLLIVEDEIEQVKLLQILLSSTHDLTFAETAEAGLKAYAETSPDLLVVDIRLPDYSGFGLLQRLRRAHQPLVPVIVLTAFWNEINVATAMKLGCFACIDKRNAARDLNYAVEEALSGDPKVAYSFDPEPQPMVEELVAGLSAAEKKRLRELLQVAPPPPVLLPEPVAAAAPPPEKARLCLQPTPEQEAQIQELFAFYQEIVPWLQEQVTARPETQRHLHANYYQQLYRAHARIHSQHFNRALSYFAERHKRVAKKRDLQPWETLGKFAIFDSKCATIMPDVKTLTLALPPRTGRRTRISFSAPAEILRIVPKAPKTLVPLIWDDEGYWLELPLKPSYPGESP